MENNSYNISTAGLGGEIPSTPAKSNQINISVESACIQLQAMGDLLSNLEAAAWEQEKKGKYIQQDMPRKEPETVEAAGAAVIHNNPPRPPNKFIIFRSVLTRKLRTLKFRDNKGRTGTLKNGLKSSILGHYWKSLSEAEQKPWFDIAARVQNAHSLAYPDYQFKPVSRKRSPKKRECAVTLVVRESSLGVREQKKKRKLSSPALMQYHPTVPNLVSTSRSGVDLSVNFSPAPFSVKPQQEPHDRLYIPFATPPFDTRVCDPGASPCPYEGQYRLSERMNFQPQAQDQFVYPVETMQPHMAQTSTSLPFFPQLHSDALGTSFIPASTYNFYSPDEMSVSLGIQPYLPQPEGTQYY